MYKGYGPNFGIPWYGMFGNPTDNTGECRSNQTVGFNIPTDSNGKCILSGYLNGYYTVADTETWLI